MVLQVIVRQKSSSQKYFIEQNWRLRKEWIANAMQRMGENTYIIPWQLITPIKKLNFLTRPDVAFGFLNKGSGNEIKRLVLNKLKAKLLLSSATYFYISYLIPCVKDKSFSYWWRWENKPTFFWVVVRWGTYRQNKSVNKYH